MFSGAHTTLRIINTRWNRCSHLYTFFLATGPEGARAAIAETCFPSFDLGLPVLEEDSDGKLFVVIIFLVGKTFNEYFYRTVTSKFRRLSKIGKFIINLNNLKKSRSRCKTATSRICNRIGFRYLIYSLWFVFVTIKMYLYLLFFKTCPSCQPPSSRPLLKESTTFLTSMCALASAQIQACTI